ncbi:hypothetical protein D5S17_18135 [Pseudonocardiaceae bacterium YIM PH 21723]|nr:hypothetical protein D5S17_18135 [Pseudonocardiaceae bacterium YIM PH 21723]
MTSIRVHQVLFDELLRQRTDATATLFCDHCERDTRCYAVSHAELESNPLLRLCSKLSEMMGLADVMRGRPYACKNCHYVVYQYG